MIKLLLTIFAVVVLVLLAAAWVIDTNQFRWQCGALAAFVATFLPFTDVAVPSRKREQ